MYGCGEECWFLRTCDELLISRDHSQCTVFDPVSPVSIDFKGTRNAMRPCGPNAAFYLSVKTKCVHYFLLSHRAPFKSQTHRQKKSIDVLLQEKSKIKLGYLG
jgi:hypothetical protein